MFSRLILTFLAFVAAVFQADKRAWAEAVGLAALGFGLMLLQLAATRPALRRYSYLAFTITAVCVLFVFFRRYL
jgi:hypothetical protein